MLLIATLKSPMLRSPGFDPGYVPGGRCKCSLEGVWSQLLCSLRLWRSRQSQSRGAVLCNAVSVNWGQIWAHIFCLFRADQSAHKRLACSICKLYMIYHSINFVQDNADMLSLVVTRIHMICLSALSASQSHLGVFQVLPWSPHV